jgi:hypothetical protein
MAAGQACCKGDFLPYTPAEASLISGISRRYGSYRWPRARFVQKPTPSSAPDQFVGDFGFAS